MINIFFKQIKAKQAFEVRKFTLELIFFILFDRFTILLLILLSFILLPLFVLNSFLLDLVQPSQIKIARVIIFRIEVNKTTILLKLFINHL